MKPVVEVDSDHVFFVCPGCGMGHSLPTVPGNHPSWSFNGDAVKPTLKPSILARWEWGPQKEKRVCHSFVTDGNIQFLGDCTHDLKNQTIALPPFGE